MACLPEALVWCRPTGWLESDGRKLDRQAHYNDNFIEWAINELNTDVAGSEC